MNQYLRENTECLERTSGTARVTLASPHTVTRNVVLFVTPRSHYFRTAKEHSWTFCSFLGIFLKDDAESELFNFKSWNPLENEAMPFNKEKDSREGGEAHYGGKACLSTLQLFTLGKLLNFKSPPRLPQG